MIARFLAWFSSFLHATVITRGNRGEPYLERFSVRAKPDGDQRYPWGVYLHHFLVDDDYELHNHPFQAASLILTGGYTETRIVDGKYIWRELRPGMINRLGPDTMHRVDLLDPKRGAWTLFFYWGRTPSWGFWNPLSNTFMDWKRHKTAAGRSSQKNAST